MRRPRHTPPGFTLIELLVTIAVIAVIISITLPALASARSAGKRLQCLSVLSGLGQTTAAYAHDHAGEFPSAFKGTEPAYQNIIGWGSGIHPILPADQIFFWMYPLRDYLHPTNIVAQAEASSCPEVFGPEREWDRERNDEHFTPSHYSFLSYSYSPACYTEPSAWRDPNTPPDLNTVHHANQVALTRTPAKKTLLVEYASRHDQRPEHIWNAANGNFTLLAVDGHAETVRAQRSTTPFPFRGFSADSFSFFPWIENPVALFASKGGILGRDWN